jgi:uncharacterized membrane protein YidH (DUF202 family)
VSERHVLAWIAGALTAIVVTGLLLRRMGALVRSDSRYRVLERATLVATAVAAGALTDLAVFLIVSGG